MKDWIFFPLALLVAAAFVFIAINPFADRAPSGPVSAGGRNAEDVTVKGEELHRFVTGDTGDFGGLSFEQADGSLVLKISRLAEQKYESPRSGPHLVLAEDLEYAFSSRPIEVIVEARSVGDFAATDFEVNYMTRAGEGGESGWKKFTLTREFAPYAMQWTTPSRGASEGYDFVGVRPVAPDKRRTIEVKSVRLHAVGKKVINVPAQ
jgi:hypothetical protein